MNESEHGSSGLDKACWPHGGLNMVITPWNSLQIDTLAERQLRSDMHPYTCGQCSDRLWPKAKGWFCIKCDMIVQNWAHDTDVDGSFRKAADVH
jgi:hypothetical protein